MAEEETAGVEQNRRGFFGNGKEHYGLDMVLYSIENGSEI